MGDLCRLCSGPHPTRHHGARDPADEKPPPQGYPKIAWCPDCETWHPEGDEWSAGESWCEWFQGEGREP